MRTQALTHQVEDLANLFDFGAGPIEYATTDHFVARPDQVPESAILTFDRRCQMPTPSCIKDELIEYLPSGSSKDLLYIGTAPPEES